MFSSAVINPPPTMFASADSNRSKTSRVQLIFKASSIGYNSLVEKHDISRKTIYRGYFNRLFALSNVALLEFGNDFDELNLCIHLRLNGMIFGLFV